MEKSPSLEVILMPKKKKTFKIDERPLSRPSDFSISAVHEKGAATGSPSPWEMSIAGINRSQGQEAKGRKKTHVSSRDQ